MTHTQAYSPPDPLVTNKPAWMQVWSPSLAPIEGILRSDLSIAEKRETLSSWASDALAVADAPALRKLDTGATVGIDDILDALKKLDVAARENGFATSQDAVSGQARVSPHGWLGAVFRGRQSDDDDDDPPPCPAVIAPIPRLPPSGAELDLEAA